MKLTEFIPASGIVFRVPARGPEEILEALAQRLAANNDLRPELVLAALLEREQLGSTALGHELAVPHAKMSVPKTVGVLGLSEGGVALDAPDGAPVRIFVAFLSPNDGGRHLQALAAVAQELADARFRSLLLAAKSAEDVYRLLSSPPGEAQAAG